ncbi:hypothetical protein NEUTE1DRAFT_97620 [Neurospora tetrasperma FGSC 2508]|uniref:Uncharacterized protein n=1 Tax=Neurospora tetrasperma (strain FGSC 2508 / ATCC MYA-4615 / P0657) TaxID=510951 RepID=F8MCF5_NEUT8|nr:uncharacterized protein NEUTE1DRAFT_97620 [Neurospora tetrasperma FGSC 2508]EGO60456.1 hypothetical protein NEUTE1DRAFT_97620 [Neurospora tetrasperma FGSC 2508]
MSYVGQIDDRYVFFSPSGPSGSWRVNVVYLENKRFTSQKGVRKTASRRLRSRLFADGAPMGPRMVTRHPFILVKRSRSPVSLSPRRRFGRPTPPHPAPSPTLLASKQHIIISELTKTATSLRSPKKNLSPSKISSLRQAENPKMVP